MPVEQFTGEGGFFSGVLSDVSNPFFLSAGISALAVGLPASSRSDEAFCFVPKV